MQLLILLLNCPPFCFVTVLLLPPTFSQLTSLPHSLPCDWACCSPCVLANSNKNLHTYFSVHTLELRDNETDLTFLAATAIPDEADVDVNTEDTPVNGTACCDDAPFDVPMAVDVDDDDEEED